jgi:lipopolysaccharide transport system permease protein
MNSILLSAWRYRYFIFSSIKNEFRIKFARSRLGVLWMVLHPLSQVLIFAFILSTVMSAKLNQPGIDNKYAYTIYLMAGILGWSLFFEIVNRCLTLFIDNANILKKLAFPKIALPLIATGSALVNNALLFFAIILIFGVLGHLPGTALVWLPVLMIVNIALALGVGLTLGVFNVFIRDIGQIVPVILQLLYWFTPIVYMVQIIPARYQIWLPLNPLFYLIQGYQNVLFYDRAPNWGGMCVVALGSICFLAFAFFIFRKANSEIVDLL